MPYKLRKLPNKDLYRVYNAKTGEIHSYGTTLENAKKQITLLNMVDAGVPLTKQGGAISQSEKKKIAEEIRPITKEEAKESYLDLADEKTIPPDTSTKGNTFVDYFTFLERLETTGNKGISFWEFWEDKSEYMKKNYVRNLLEYMKKKGDDSLVKNLYKVFKVYFGSVGIFKPVIAMSIYHKYKPTSVLDFTMGWGGRLVGAAALDVPKYTGIDLNKNLEKPYREMEKSLKELGTKTDIKLIFQDALKVDYSKLDYDMVFTSPPYYNVELYRGTNKMTEEEWNEKFYKPLFTETYKYLKSGGHYILNVPIAVYENVLVKLFGKADKLIPMNTKRSMSKKLKQAEYKEFIYVWNKKEKRGAGIETDRFFEDKVVSLPEFKSVKVELPTYMYKRLPDINGKPPPYRYRLVNPITETRTIASRKKEKSVDIKRKAIPQPFTFYEESDELPKLEEFSPKDQEKIQEYYKDVEKNERKNRDEIADQPANNVPRGFPITMYKTADRMGYRQTDQKVYKKKEVVEKPVKQRKEPKAPTEKKPRGRPKKPRKQVRVADYDEPDDFFAKLTQKEVEKIPPAPVKEPSVKAPTAKAPSVVSDESLDDEQLADLYLKDKAAFREYMNKKKGKGIENKISTNSNNMNSWVQYVKEYASKNGMKYNEALKDPACKAGYKKGAGLVSDVKSAVKTAARKVGLGIVDEAAAAGYADQVLIADAYNQKNLGSQKKYITL
jgi:hypothetical protein